MAGVTDVREEVKEGARCFFNDLCSPKKKKEEEVGSNFICKYSGKGQTDSEVFNDKWGLTLNQNGWGRGEKKCPKN